MKNKGFTLVELLGVLAILAAISLVALPSLLNQIKKAKNNIDSKSKMMINAAAQLYVNDNADDYKKIGGSTYCIAVRSLADSGKLDKNLVDEKYFDSKAVRVTYSDSFNYEVVDASECGYYDIALNGAYPELYQGFLPITYINGIPAVADTSKQWYSYGDHQWANAVLVNCSDTSIKNKYFNADMTIKSEAIGTQVSEADILQYYVWIPRYSYMIWISNDTELTNPSKIDIIFQGKDAPKLRSTTKGSYYTHPAFTFGDKELNGFWFAKFMASGTSTNLTVKPNMSSFTNVELSSAFYISANMKSMYASNYGLKADQIDTHITKNMEWGAVAYLSSSVYGRYLSDNTCVDSGCMIWNNATHYQLVGAYTTGCSGQSATAAVVSEKPTCVSGYSWNAGGVAASTTGNIYGVYDTSGTGGEYIMAFTEDSYGRIANVYFPAVESKYYDRYSYNTSESLHTIGKFGDATKETAQSTSLNWNNSLAKFPYGNCAEVEEDGCMDLLNVFERGNSNIFGYVHLDGAAYISVSFRPVIVGE